MTLMYVSGLRIGCDGDNCNDECDFKQCVDGRYWCAFFCDHLSGVAKQTRLYKCKRFENKRLQDVHCDKDELVVQ